MNQDNLSHVLFAETPTKNGVLGVITLNRPEALNALSKNMIVAITQKIISWREDANISMVLIKSSSEKAFCAGGDIKRLYTLGPQYAPQEVEYFRSEYNLCKLIHHYPKPFIAILDGIAMGGGLGLSVHASHVVASEKLRLAMPETKIGIYPDVGASYFLSRCPNNIGMYLGLTGNIIGVADAVFCGLVDNFVPHAQLNDLLLGLINSPLEDVLQEQTRNLGEGELYNKIKIIEECFSKGSVQEIIDSLELSNSDWAKQQANIIKTRSPTSLKVTFKELTRAKHQTFDECMEMEFNLTTQIIKTHDVYEGIRAVLIDKTHDAKWQPAKLSDVDDNYIDKMFQIKCTL